MTAPSAPYDFDTVIERRDTSCYKWTLFGEDVLPLWVAEMDFKTAPEILTALHARVDHGIFGYEGPPQELRELIVARMKDRYDWDIAPEEIVFNPGMVLMLNVVTQAVGQAGDGILMNTPVYGPFHKIPSNRGRFPQMVDMVRVDHDDQSFTYALDFDRLEEAILPQTSLYYLCDPHNPAGYSLQRADREQLAELCLRHNITIAADHIHGDLLMEADDFAPLAAIAPEIAENTVTMFAPSKTFNLAGLPCTFAIVKNAKLRQRIATISQMSGYHAGNTAYTAATAAYRDGDDWLRAALDYMRANRDYAVAYMREHMPQLRFTIPSATYLMWIDGREVDTGEKNLQEFFLQEAKVAFNAGTFFGKHYDDYVRLNFACPRSILAQALERMASALN